jgi:hypothetical protein
LACLHHRFVNREIAAAAHPIAGGTNANSYRFPDAVT